MKLQLKENCSYHLPQFTEIRNPKHRNSSRIQFLIELLESAVESEMDAEARKRAAYRAKLNSSKTPKQRLDSPLVRYNEHDQPVCRVCEVVLKSDSQWPAHQASRKHHEAIDTLKANATAKSQVSNVKLQPPKEIPEPKSVVSERVHGSKPETSNASLKTKPSSGLPSDFFDNQESKRQKKDMGSTKMVNVSSHRDASTLSQACQQEPIGLKMDGSFKDPDVKISAMQQSKTSEGTASSVTNQVKGSLPAGFFDNKDADLRARGITLVKPDVKDELKEFEKLIQEDLKDVDNRMEEEEIDAAETIEEAESVEQKTYWERVEMLKRKKSELQAAKTVSGKGVVARSKKSSVEESSSDDDSDDDFTVDWRAKHI